ncbi:Nucleoplasmin-like domain-containing protein [Hirschfeldia incana]|nr:Nucleoplasmin-like domain-containing protein [Hirschfeldia incana]
MPAEILKTGLSSSSFPIGRNPKLPFSLSNLPSSRTPTMEFWGAKVKAGKTLKVKPGDNCLIHISQASLGKAKKGVSALLYATVDDKRLLLGTLSQDSFPHINFDHHLLFDKEFELSHSLDRGYVHFIGHQRNKKKKKKRANESSTVSVSFNTGKSVLQPCLQSKTNLKKQKIHKDNSEEIKEMNKSIKELSEAVKTLQQILLTKADLPEEKETPKDKEEEEDSCCFGCKEAKGNNDRTIFVKGFENLRPRNEIKTALSNFFASCGEITRVYVPIECKNRLPLGFAFINLRNGKGNEKALELNGSYMGGRELEVTMASHREEYYGFTDFHGCERCPIFLSPPVYKPSSSSSIIKKRRIYYW